MSVIDEEERKDEIKKYDNPVSQQMRGLVRGGAKSLKTQWIMVGRTLVSIWRDRLFEYWGYEKFDHYATRELGMKKAVALKIIKSYLFLENYESQSLATDFAEREPSQVPELDAISALRSARERKELSREDYVYLRGLVFDKATPAANVRRIMKNRIAEVNRPDEEEAKAQYRSATIRRVSQALDAFKIQARHIEGLDPEIVKQAQELFNRLVNT